MTKIIHGATEVVSAKKIKPRRPYVTDEILEVSAHRTRLIKTISREEKYAKHLDHRRVIKAWKEVSRWIAGHRCPTHEPWNMFVNSRHAFAKDYQTPMLTNCSGTKRSRQEQR